MLQRLWIKMGFKPHLFRCPGGNHEWRNVYGDEIIHIGWKRAICSNCPATRDELQPGAG